MGIRMNQYPKVKCLNCGKEIGECNFRTFTVNSKCYDKNGKRKLFCSQECYEKYKKQFEVEVYNNNPIYAVEYLGEIRYMPYWFSNYYFTNIEDCRKRIDMNNIGIYPSYLFGSSVK